MREKIKALRHRIYEIVEISQQEDTISNAYDIFMIGAIFVSLLPLTLKQTTMLSVYTDKVTTWIFIVDYALRLLTADVALKKGKWSFVLYPFTFLAVIDLVSILSSLYFLSTGLKALKVLRMIRTFRALRAFKVTKAFRIFRYSKTMDIIIDVVQEQRVPLMAVGTLAVGYILIAALVIFNVEPDTFNSYFDAIYWATVSLTTVGYGDIYAVSVAGRIVTMISSFVGIAIVALPSGIITAGYMEALQKQHDDEDEGEE